MIVCLGDFFDKPDLNQYEITAAKDIKWSNIPHYFIVGNHESGVGSLEYSSAKFLEGPGREIVSSPTLKTFGDTELAFLPYITESDRRPLTEIFTPKCAKNRILLSHNDIKGIQLGPVESKTGYEIPELENCADLCINGHLHNGQKISPKVINLGNLTGKDFGEDAMRYPHNIMIIDTSSMTYKLVENPYAFNFYKIEVDNKADLNKVHSLKPQAVLSIKCDERYVDDLKHELESEKNNITDYRIIISRSAEIIDKFDSSTLTLHTGDHLQKLIDYCREKLDNSDILNYELGELCK